MRKLLAVFIVCMVLSAGCAPMAAPTPAPVASDFGIFSREPCGAPCFQGITPGVTTFENAASILEKEGVLCTTTDTAHAKILDCKSGDVAVQVATVGLCTRESTAPLVGGIGLILPVKTTLGELIAHHGPPDAAAISEEYVLFSYESLQTFVLAITQPRQPRYTFTPGTAIDAVIYVTAAEYRKCLQTDEWDLQPWKGYGTYAPVQTATPTPSPAPTPTPTALYPGLSIMMEIGSFLPESDQRFDIAANGNASYVRWLHGEIWEHEYGKLTSQQIEELVAAIRKADVFALEDNYAEPIFEGEDITLNITLDGQSKHIWHYGEDCHGLDESSHTGVPYPPMALCELERTIRSITNSGQWVKIWSMGAPTTPTAPTETPVVSSAKAVVTVYSDMNANGTPEPDEYLSHIAVEMRLFDGTVLKRSTQRGIATFDMSGCVTGTRVTAILPGLHRNYEFYLPQNGTVPIVFGLAQ